MAFSNIQVITINTKHTKTKLENIGKRSDVKADADGDADAGGAVDHTIELKAFGKEFVVPLKRNLNILSPFANVVDTFIDPETGTAVS